jgi:hypothetical protein
MTSNSTSAILEKLLTNYRARHISGNHSLEITPVELDSEAMTSSETLSFFLKKLPLNPPHFIDQAIELDSNIYAQTFQDFVQFPCPPETLKKVNAMLIHELERLQSQAENFPEAKGHLYGVLPEEDGLRPIGEIMARVNGGNISHFEAGDEQLSSAVKQMKEDRNLYLHQNGADYGPLSLKSLQLLWARDLVSDDDHVFQQGWPGWRSVGDYLDGMPPIGLRTPAIPRP